MDKQRIGYARRKRTRGTVAGFVAAVAFLVMVWAVSRIEPAAPSVDAAVVFTDAVRRGQMVRQVRGTGTLVPKTVVVILASDVGRVERRFIQPGQAVGRGSVLLALSSPPVEQEYLEAAAQLGEAQADLANLQAQLEDQHLTQKSVTADVEEQFLQAKAQHDADLELSRSGLPDRVTLMKSRVAMEQLTKRLQLERALDDARNPSVEAQLATRQARIEQMEALLALREEKVDRLRLRAGMDGVPQGMDVEVGLLVDPGDELARVSDPKHLKAELKIPETLVDDVAVGQRAEVDTRNGVIERAFSRIDPGAVEGTVLVNAHLRGPMSRGARPTSAWTGRSSVSGSRTCCMWARPIHAREESPMGLFKLDGDQTHASRVQVRVGKVSVGTIEIRSSVSEGDKVVLSEISAWDAYDRIRLE